MRAVKNKRAIDDTRDELLQRPAKLDGTDGMRDLA
jgi:hypothetical protein